MHNSSQTPPLVPYDDALNEFLTSAVQVNKTKTLQVSDALHRITSEDVKSPIQVPPHDNSAMDGYAVKSDEIEMNKGYPQSQRITAGSLGSALESQTVARIFTGAPIPENADAVIMQEHASVHNDGTISFSRLPAVGDHIRPAAEDIEKDEIIITAGTKLEPQHTGLLASVGISEVSVYRRLKVVILFTGNEIVNPGQSLKAGEIYNSNYYVLKSFLDLFQCDIINLGIIKDNASATRDALTEAAGIADVVLTCGGVSVGEEDHIRTTIETFGTVRMWHLRIKPGKPLMLGCVSGTSFIGLPGNPVSAFVTFLLFVRPFLLRKQGVKNVTPLQFSLPAGFDWARPSPRREFTRARLVPDKSGNQSIELHHHQGSGVMSSTTWADGLAVIPEDKTFGVGDAIDFIPFSELMK